ncbi:hypothetical protein [Yinghuangia sp. YIM S09857]|uniref:hypothetical protein n=1 Tax=Yinghuangia sp. YIM S09857 TaxID=3436929 RepID=UPI003F5329C5
MAGPDPILDAWLFDDNGNLKDPPAEPASATETRLASAPGSTATGPAGLVRVTAHELHTSAQALLVLKAELNTDMSAAINATADERVSKSFELGKALEQVQVRWGEKLKQLTGLMDEHIGDLHDTANEWEKGEQTATDTITVI